MTLSPSQQLIALAPAKRATIALSEGAEPRTVAAEKARAQDQHPQHHGQCLMHKGDVNGRGIKNGQDAPDDLQAQHRKDQIESETRGGMG